MPYPVPIWRRRSIEHRHLGGGLFVDYADLAEAVLTSIAAHFGLELDDRAAMAAAARHDSKVPNVAFVPDGERKRIASSKRWRVCPPIDPP